MYASSNEPLRDAAPIYTWSFIEISAGLCCASVAGKSNAPIFDILGLTILRSDHTSVHGI
jgi:hypothetical protein